MICYYLTTDLMFFSRAMRISGEQGVELQIVSSDAQLLQETSTRPPDLVVIDLMVVSGDLQQVVAQLRQTMPQGRVIAYGPHVREEKLAAARAAGCDTILTQGQFHAQINQIFSSRG